MYSDYRPDADPLPAWLPLVAMLSGAAVFTAGVLVGLALAVSRLP